MVVVVVEEVVTVEVVEVEGEVVVEVVGEVVVEVVSWVSMHPEISKIIIHAIVQKFIIFIDFMITNLDFDYLKLKLE